MEKYLHALASIFLKENKKSGVGELNIGDFELEALARQSGNEIHLSETLTQDVQLMNRVGIEEAPPGRYRLGQFADGHRDLVERQREILLRALIISDEPED